MSATTPGRTLRALLFDVDGTLADTEEVHRVSFNDAMRELGLPHAWDEAAYAALLAVPGGKERLAHYAASLPAAEGDRLRSRLPELHARKTELYTRRVARGGCPLRPGIERLLDEAAEAGVLLGIATTTSAPNVTALLEATLGPGGPGRFATVACGDMVAAKKPAPDVYRLALAALGVQAGEAIAFEDSSPGLRASKAAGLFTVVTPTRWTRDQPLDAADVLVPHLGDPGCPLPPPHDVLAAGPFLTLARLATLAGHG